MQINVYQTQCCSLINMRKLHQRKICVHNCMVPAKCI